MKLKTTFNTAMAALKLNLARSLLTTLGVVIGVFAIVTLISLVQGLQNYVSAEFEVLGSNLLFVYPGSGGLANDPALAFSNNKLSEKHVDLIEQNASSVIEHVSPMIQTGGFLTYKNKNYNAGVIGGEALIQEMFNLEVEEGRQFSESEARLGEGVAVLGNQVKQELFGNSSPLGKEIKMESEKLTVIGYMPKKGQDYDTSVMIPIKLAENIFNLKKYTYLAISLKSKENVSADAKVVEMALLKDLDKEDFTIYTQQDLLDQVQSILDILKFGMGAVSGISLLVGGIGIMNIMLVSVTERIREIGLRKALGATRSRIALQFLVEAIVLSSVGGTFGLGLGFVGTFVAQKWLDARITPNMVILALGFSLVVGIIFGTYPAVQASKKDPIEALSYE